MQSSKFSLVIFLVIIVAILGFAIYKYKPIGSNPMTTIQPPATPPPTPVSPVTPPTVSPTPSAVSITLPGANATEQDFLNYYNKVNAQSVAATSLTLNSCKPTPFVAKFKKGITFEIINADSVKHTFTYQKNTTFDVAANGKKTIKIDQTGIYPYSCDDIQQSKTTGFLMVISQ